MLCLGATSSIVRGAMIAMRPLAHCDRPIDADQGASRLQRRPSRVVAGRARWPNCIDVELQGASEAETIHVTLVEALNDENADPSE